MPLSVPSALVSTQWLADHLNAPDVRIVDASYYLPEENRNPAAEYQQEHIPGAVFFDIDDICDSESALPHMLPSAEKFSSRVRKMGLGDGNRIVVYDTAGLFSAARVWWMFKAMGAQDVRVLDGGLPKWKAEMRPLSDMPPIPSERHFTARVNNMMIRDLDEMRALAEADPSTGVSEQIVDARSLGRFEGTEAEPRAGLRAGHIPGSVNVHYAALLNEDKTLKAPDALKQIFQAAKVDIAGPIVTTCGSGVTAAILMLALNECGADRLALYDGSWAEWGALEDTPIEAA